MGRHGSVGGKLGLHDVTCGAAELNGVHLLDSPITELAGDHYVCDGHHRKEDAYATPRRAAVLHFVQIRDDFALGQRDADGDQDQSCEEHNGNRDEKQQPDVGIVHPPATDVQRQHEQPRKSRERDQRHAQHADPTAGE